MPQTKGHGSRDKDNPQGTKILHSATATGRTEQAYVLHRMLSAIGYKEEAMTRNAIFMYMSEHSPPQFCSGYESYEPQ